MKRSFILSVLILNVFGSGTRISKKKCDGYKQNFQSISREHDASDDYAAPKEFPFMALITNGKDYHSGVLISEQFVISNSNFNLGKSYVILGDLDFETNEDDARPQTYDVVEEFFPFEISAQEVSSIKLLKLNTSVKFNRYVQPACLPQSQSVSLASAQLTAIGWNIAFIRSNFRLHKMELNFVSNSQCEAQYQSTSASEYVQQIYDGTIFCVVVKKDNQDKCTKYFSAGLVNTIRPNSFPLYEISGIVSKSFGCIKNKVHPSVCVRVSAYIDWIESIVWPILTTTTQGMSTKEDTKITTPEMSKFTSTEPSTTTTSISTSTKPDQPYDGIKSPNRGYIAAIITLVAIILLLVTVGASITIFKMMQSKKSLNTMCVQLNMGNGDISINTRMES